MNERERLFCREYLVDMNATAAALRAGYRQATARNAAGWIRERNPRKPELKAEVERLLQARTKEADLTVERVLSALQKIAFGEDADLRSKLRSLEMCARYLGMFRNGRVQTSAAPVIVDDIGPV